MSSLRFVFVVAFLAALALALPAPERRGLQQRSFKVPRQLNPAHPGPNGALAMKKVFRKYNLVAKRAENETDGIIGNTTTSNAKQPQMSSTPSMGGDGESGTVMANPEQNAALFLSPVDVGGQKLNLDFDSGSSDLWMFSTKLSQDVIGQHTAFDPSKSPTFKSADGLQWNISYGDGSGASGVVGTDVVTIGGVKVMDQTVELANNVSASFQMDMDTDGLVGLAFSKLNTVNDNGKKLPQKTFFDNVMGNLDMPVFTADLEPDGTGNYEFGKIDSTKFVGQMAWAPVNSASGFWQFTSDKFAIGNGQVVDSPKASPAIADTGTSLMLVDQPVADAYYSQVKGAILSAQAGGYIYPCGTTLPDISVAAGNNMIKVPGRVINFAAVDSQKKVCFGGVQGNGGSGMQIYGDIMFRAQLVAFNGGNSSLGFGQKPV